MLQDISESNESKRNRKPWKTLRSISNKRCFRTHFPRCYKTNGSWFKLCFYLVLDALGNYREFNKLRRQQQGKRHIKIELCVKSLAIIPCLSRCAKWAECTFGCLARMVSVQVKAKSERFTAASSRCRQNLKYENFTSSFGRLRQNIAPKSVPHVQHAYFSSFIQSNHWFVALSLTLPKFPNYALKKLESHRTIDECFAASRMRYNSNMNQWNFGGIDIRGFHLTSSAPSWRKEHKREKSFGNWTHPVAILKGLAKLGNIVAETMFLVMFSELANLGNMFRTQNLCLGSKSVFDSRQKHFLSPRSKICFRNTFPARLNWETFASATIFPSLARP